MKNFCSFTKALSLSTLCLGIALTLHAQSETGLQGVIKDHAGRPVAGATIYIGALSTGTTSDQQGNYRIKGAFEGTYLVKASYLGYKTYQQKITFHKAKTVHLDIVLQPATKSLEAVVVSAMGRAKEIEAMAFNVDVLDTKKLKNTNLSAGEALNRVSGVRVRQSGGVGSAMNLSINGFTGKQVKVFIDGVPMSNFGSSFQLNNIPVGMTKRIEVYKGVVPIRLGADALGGAINIVTNQLKKTHVNISYSYGSFNTHHSTLNAAYVAQSGFTARLRAYQNYSDNNYWMDDLKVADLQTGKYYPDQRVRRFHDTYHNETAIAELGVVNKSYADELLFGITLGKNYDEVQTGARVESVFGSWYTAGNIVMPTFKYQKEGLILDKLNVNITANYNLGAEKIVDTVNRRYNWLGEFISYKEAGGERNYSLYEYRNNTGVLTANLSYRINDKQTLSLSNVANTFNRKGSDRLDPEDEIYKHPKRTFKNVLGLGYRYKDEKWSSSLFLKHYTQVNRFAQSYNPSGEYGDIAYRNRKSTFSKIGYGITGTYFFTRNLQVKASYEKSYRLPAANELFGNLVTLQGNIELAPETSNNYNLGASYSTPYDKDHRIDGSVNLFYRDAADFIRPRLNNNQTMQVMDNLFSVTNLGVAAEAGYSYKEAFSIGASFTYQELRNNTKYVAEQTTESIVYRDRIPNMPYLFGNMDATYAFSSPINKTDDIRIGYNMIYVHSFFLFWPSLGDKKFDVPYQISHNMNITYTLGKKDNMQLTFSCRNITDNKLYDNFSLQKPGRSFSGKVSYSF